jgi:hypothetical protein
MSTGARAVILPNMSLLFRELLALQSELAILINNPLTPSQVIRDLQLAINNKTAEINNAFAQYVSEVDYLRPLANSVSGLEHRITDLENQLNGLPAMLDKENPLPNSIFNTANVKNDLMFWLVMAVMAKKNPQSAERIILKMYDVSGQALGKLCSAAVGNKVAAWGGGQLLSLFMERCGFITQEQAMNYQLGATIIAGASTIKDLTSIFRDLPIISWFVGPKEGTESPFPSTVSLAENVIPALMKLGSVAAVPVP